MGGGILGAAWGGAMLMVEKKRVAALQKKGLTAREKKNFSSAAFIRSFYLFSFVFIFFYSLLFKIFQAWLFFGAIIYIFFFFIPITVCILKLCCYSRGHPRGVIMEHKYNHLRAT